MDEDQKEQLKNKALNFARWAKEKTAEAGKTALPVAKVVAKKTAEAGAAVVDTASKLVDDMAQKHADRAELEKEENTWHKRPRLL